MKNSKFVIRMKDGLYYSHMEKSRIMVVQNRNNAQQFDSRMSAAAACGQSSQFAGAAILGLDENPDAPAKPPEAP